MRELDYGARLERGRVVRVTEEGCVVRSLDRSGVESLPLRARGEETYSAGETVYFFLFADGTGLILCSLERGEEA